MGTEEDACPICRQTPRDTRALPCGHSYCGSFSGGGGLERPCIELLLKDQVLTDKSICIVCLQQPTDNHIDSGKYREIKQIPKHVELLRGNNDCSRLDVARKWTQEVLSLLRTLVAQLEEQDATLAAAEMQQVHSRNNITHVQNLTTSSDFLQVDPVLSAETKVNVEELRRAFGDILKLDDGSSAPGISGVPRQDPTPAVEREACSSRGRISTSRPPLIASAREVASVAGERCLSVACVDDVIFTLTRSGIIVKYRWIENEEKLTVTEVQRSGPLFAAFLTWLPWFHCCLAATRVLDEEQRLRLYVCQRFNVQRRDPDSLELVRAIDTSSLTPCGHWAIAACDTFLAVHGGWDASDGGGGGSSINLYKEDVLVRRLRRDSQPHSLALSARFLASSSRREVRVMRWDEGSDALTPLYTLPVHSTALHLSDHLLMTSQHNTHRLVLLDLATGQHKLLTSDSSFAPRSVAIARRDLFVGINQNTDNLSIMKLI